MSTLFKTFLVLPECPSAFELEASEDRHPFIVVFVFGEVISHTVPNLANKADGLTLHFAFFLANACEQ